MRVSSERGSAAVIILAIIAVAGIGAAGYFAYQNYQVARHATPAAPSSPAAAPTDAQVAAGKTLVDDFYKEYVKPVGGSYDYRRLQGTYLDAQAVARIDAEYAKADAAVKAAQAKGQVLTGGADLVLCGQNMAETQSVEYTGYTADQLTYNFIQNYDEPSKVPVTVSRTTGLITRIDCPYEQ